MPVTIRETPRLNRFRLENILRGELRSNKNPFLERMLKQAIEGLVALEHGEVQPILAPVKTNDHGVTPFSAKKYRMMAAGFCDLLRKKGYQGKNAESKVSLAYGGVSDSTLDSWKNLSKDPSLKSFREEIAKSEHWDEHQLMTKLKEAGNFYTHYANKKKKEVKEAKKQAGKKKAPKKKYAK